MPPTIPDTVTPSPNVPPLPFTPQANHPTTSDVDQMINSRIAATLEQLRYESSQKQTRQNVYTAVGIGVGGLAVGVASTMLVGRIVRGRRARNAAMK